VTSQIPVQASSGNVFADLELDNSKELIVKAELARRISNIIATQEIDRSEAATLFGIDRDRLSDLVNGKSSSFSTDQLFRFLNALGRDVEIVVKSKSDSQAQTRVVPL